MGFISDTVNDNNITTDVLRMLYVHQLSENEAVLMTVEGFGITTEADGVYTCLARNNLTEDRMTINIRVLGNCFQTLV